MFKKFREFLIDEKDVEKMKELMTRLGYKTRTGNCGWALAPTCNFVFTWLNNKNYINLLQELAKTDIELLPPTTGYERA